MILPDSNSVNWYSCSVEIPNSAIYIYIYIFLDEFDDENSVLLGGGAGGAGPMVQ